MFSWGKVGERPQYHALKTLVPYPGTRAGVPDTRAPATNFFVAKLNLVSKFQFWTILYSTRTGYPYRGSLPICVVDTVAASYYLQRLSLLGCSMLGGCRWGQDGTMLTSLFALLFSTSISLGTSQTQQVTTGTTLSIAPPHTTPIAVLADVDECAAGLHNCHVRPFNLSQIEPFTSRRDSAFVLQCLGGF
eukprot:1695143-Rhodomonas_salina.1